MVAICYNYRYKCKLFTTLFLCPAGRYMIWLEIKVDIFIPIYNNVFVVSIIMKMYNANSRYPYSHNHSAFITVFCIAYLCRIFQRTIHKSSPESRSGSLKRDNRICYIRVVKDIFWVMF